MIIKIVILPLSIEGQRSIANFHMHIPGIYINWNSEKLREFLQDLL